MKNMNKILALLLVLCTVLGCIVACGEENTASNGTQNAGVNNGPSEWVDYVSQVKLDMNSLTAKIEIPASQIKQHIDGDTTHFNIPKTTPGIPQKVVDTGVIKARYLAVNTPESTGQIEEWGKKASNFTKEKLKSAVSIVIESDTSTWNYDSTGDRLLVWIWYKTEDGGEYKNLNLEILQEGLAIASNSANNIYGTYCMKAIDQAKAYKLNVYSEEDDPDFYYGEAFEVTIKELRANADKYAGKKVAFEGIVVKNSGDNGVYVEAYDEETQMYNGIYVYYGFNFSQMSLIKPGNRVRIVGSMQFYEAGGTYQIADLKYDQMKPKDPNNVQKLEEGLSAAYQEVSAQTFKSGTVSVTVIEEGEEVTKDVRYAEMALSASISMKGLHVNSVYTTDNGGKNDGAMTLTCNVDGITISVRTSVMKDEDGNQITADYFKGKTIDVKGTVDYYDGDYQIEITSLDDVTFH